MKLRDRVFLWWNGYCPHHLIAKMSYFDWEWCELCREEEYAEQAIRLEEVKRRVKAIGEQA